MLSTSRLQNTPFSAVMVNSTFWLYYWLNGLHMEWSSLSACPKQTSPLTPATSDFPDNVKNGELREQIHFFCSSVTNKWMHEYKRLWHYQVHRLQLGTIESFYPVLWAHPELLTPRLLPVMMEIVVDKQLSFYESVGLHEDVQCHCPNKYLEIWYMQTQLIADEILNTSVGLAHR